MLNSCFRVFCSAQTENKGLIEELQLVLFWMSNSFEVFEFLQINLKPLISNRVIEEKRRFVDL